MTVVVISDRARWDLFELREYSIDRFGSATAQRYIDTFKEAFAQLEKFPCSGRVVRKVTPPTRQLIRGSHRILYDLDADVVTILRVVHSAMDFDALFEE